VRSSWPVAWEPERPGSGALPVMWLALSEFRYCRHNAGNCLMSAQRAAGAQRTLEAIGCSGMLDPTLTPA